MSTPIDKLTDDAIKKRIAAIGRLIKTRSENRDELQREIDGLLAEKATLIEAQIERLKALLPAQEEK